MNVTRREFVNGLTLAGTAGLLGVGSDTASAEPPPETTRIKLQRSSAICFVPYYVAEALLRSEGFTDVQYVESEGVAALQLLLSGESAFDVWTAPTLVVRVDKGDARADRLVLGIWGLVGRQHQFDAGPRTFRCEAQVKARRFVSALSKVRLGCPAFSAPAGCRAPPKRKR